MPIVCIETFGERSAEDLTPKKPKACQVWLRPHDNGPAFCTFNEQASADEIDSAANRSPATFK